ncbi:hypothetical protein PUN4_230153 [Paraburkholderia unamae]|nr:hypothetical protein PUN4_230153 [Paraburkholderia unamae]
MLVVRAQSGDLGRFDPHRTFVLCERQSDGRRLSCGEPPGKDHLQDVLRASQPQFPRSIGIQDDPVLTQLLYRGEQSIAEAKADDVRVTKRFDDRWWNRCERDLPRYVRLRFGELLCQACLRIPQAAQQCRQVQFPLLVYRAVVR